MREPQAPIPSVDEVASHLVAAFRPRPPELSTWPAREVTLGQLRTLFIIRREGPLSIGQVAASLGVGAAAASGYAERIERHGLVERRHRTDDRRVVECHLTEAGERLLDQLAGVGSEALRRALSVLTPEERLAFDRLLLAIATRLPEADHGVGRSPGMGHSEGARADALAEPARRDRR